MTDVNDELICPDCGGHLGDAEGFRPCSCNKPSRPRPRPIPMVDGSVGSDARGPAPHLHGAPGAKLCRVCGKDLTGKPRLRDDLGYICKHCSDLEDQGKIPKPQREAQPDASPKPAKDPLSDEKLMRCPECNRKLKPLGFLPYRGQLICKSCHAHHMEHDALKVDKVSLKHHDEHEKKKVKQLAILAGVILLILIVNGLRYL